VKPANTIMFPRPELYRTPPAPGAMLVLSNLLVALLDPKLSDFGCVCFQGLGQLPVSKCGTSGYMAPEMLTGAGYTGMADVFSVGRQLAALL
jgi:serine/threonine protein kinase